MACASDHAKELKAHSYEVRKLFFEHPDTTDNQNVLGEDHNWLFISPADLQHDKPRALCHI